MSYHQALEALSSHDVYVVSIGAMDGVSHDSLFPHVVKNEHWRGLFVEPVPYYFSQLQENYGFRANLAFENAAIGSTIQDRVLYTVDTDAISANDVPEWCNGISTFNLYGPTISADGIREHLRPIVVRCRPFSDLVQEYDVPRIDVLQIDAEGADYEIFQQVWACGYRPKVVHVEIVQMTAAEQDSMKQSLESAGYSVETDSEDLTACRNLHRGGSRRNRRVAFFTYVDRAFGSIHTALCKELYVYGIDADLIDWRSSYTVEDFAEFQAAYDLFVTNPGIPAHTLINDYHVREDQICAVAHGRNDLVQAVELGNDITSLAGFAGVGSSLQRFATDLGISRPMSLVRNGIQVDRFYRPIPHSLQVLGYGGMPDYHDEATSSDCKRVNLAHSLGERLGLPLASAYPRHYLQMPTYYESVDAVIISSDESEASGLPLMEAAAAGRLPISSRVGIVSEFPNPPGVVLPLSEHEFVDIGVEVLSVLIDDSAQFRLLCQDAQEFAFEHYDWKSVIDAWVELLSEK